ncbi:MAG TPA: HEAT repeat domain-containing protein [Candidatus Limnocylindrales bacterium]
MAELEAVAQLQGWQYVGERPAGSGLPLVVIYGTPFPGVSVWYFEFDSPEICGVVVDSTMGTGGIEPVATLVQALLVPWTIEELLAEVDRAPDRGFALRRAGMGAPTELDPAWLSGFTAWASDPDPEVRLAVIDGVLGTEWRQMNPLLEEMAHRDPKRSVRKYAADAARALDSVTSGTGPERVAVPDLFSGDDAAELRRVAVSNLRPFMTE